MFKYKGTTTNWRGFVFTNMHGKWRVTKKVNAAGMFTQWDCKCLEVSETGQGVYEAGQHDTFFEVVLCHIWMEAAQARIGALEQEINLAREWVGEVWDSDNPNFAESRRDMLARLDTVLGNQSAAQEATNEQ